MNAFCISATLSECLVVVVATPLKSSWNVRSRNFITFLVHAVRVSHAFCSANSPTALARGDNIRKGTAQAFPHRCVSLDFKEKSFVFWCLTPISWHCV